MSGQFRQSLDRRFALSVVVTGVLAFGLTGGCPGGDGSLPDLFSGDTLFSVFPAGGDSDGSGGTGSTDDPGTTGVTPDSAEAADIVERTPGTVAFAELDNARLAQVIDEDGGVHEFVVFTNEAGQEYPAEYRYEGDIGTLSVTADPEGQIETIDIYDAASGSWVQVALSWTDATHALVNMTTSEDSETTAVTVELEQPLAAAKAIRSGPDIPVVIPKPRLRAQPTDEQKLSLGVKIAYQDQNGDPVTGLRTTFRLRALDNSATFGVARGDEIGPDGQYLALVPAYRYRRVAGDYPEWKPTFEWGVYTVAATSLILVTLPLSAPVQAGIAVGGWLGTTVLPGVVDRVMGGEYSDVPYPTALGQGVEYFQVRVSCNDRKHTTVISGAISYDDLYEQYIEPRKFLDLGTVTVEPYFEQPALGYRLYRVMQIGSGQIEVLPEGSENEDMPLCRFEGGGRDCAVMAALQSMSDVFPTKEQAVGTICSQVTEVKILPLAVGPGARFGNSTSNSMSDWTLISYEVYYILKACVQ